MPGPPEDRRASVESVERAADLALFVVLAIGQTWPLASDPGHLSRNDNGDTVLNEWVLAWVAHQAPRDPLHLYDANNFYPERDTLAYAEAMIPQSALAAPLLVAGRIAGPGLQHRAHRRVCALRVGDVSRRHTVDWRLGGWAGVGNPVRVQRAHAHAPAPYAGATRRVHPACAVRARCPSGTAVSAAGGAPCALVHAAGADFRVPARDDDVRDGGGGRGETRSVGRPALQADRAALSPWRALWRPSRSRHSCCPTGASTTTRA